VGSAEPQGVKKLVFGGPSTGKNFKILKVMNSLKIRYESSNNTKTSPLSFLDV